MYFTKHVRTGVPSKFYYGSYVELQEHILIRKRQYSTSRMGQIVELLLGHNIMGRPVPGTRNTKSRFFDLRYSVFAICRRHI